MSRLIYQLSSLPPPCYCNQSLSPELTCSLCKLPFHQCIQLLLQNNPFICPSCIIQSQDPIFKVQGRLAAGYIHINDAYGKQKRVIKQFRWNAQDKLQIRCIRLEEKTSQMTTWPSLANLSLNGRILSSFSPLNIMSALKRRKDEIICWEKIKQYIREQNLLTLDLLQCSKKIKSQYRVEKQGVYYIELVIIRQKNQQLFTKQLIQNSPSINQFKHFLVALFQNQPSPQTIKFNKLCPLTMEHIQIPARGIQCQHLQCFCLKNMLKMGISSRKWRCPFCNKRLYKFQVDKFLYQFCKDHSTDQIQFQRQKYLTDLLNQKPQLIQQQPLRAFTQKEICTDQESVYQEVRVICWKKDKQVLRKVCDQIRSKMAGLEKGIKCKQNQFQKVMLKAFGIS